MIERGLGAFIKVGIDLLLVEVDPKLRRGKKASCHVRIALFTSRGSEPPPETYVIRHISNYRCSRGDFRCTTTRERESKSTNVRRAITADNKCICLALQGSYPAIFAKDNKRVLNIPASADCISTMAKTADLREDTMMDGLVVNENSNLSRSKKHNLFDRWLSSSCRM